MRVKFSAIFAMALVAAVGCAPAKETTASSADDDVEMIPQGPKYGDQPIVDTGFFGGPIAFNPFGGLFGSLESMMQRMRQQMTALLNHLPGRNATLDERFPVIPFPNIDLDKGNTTSVTKIINGHKVVINETEYKEEGDLGGAFFKVRIIDVQPEENGETTEKDSEPIDPPITSRTVNKDRESVEDTLENEIPKSKEGANFGNIETFDEADFPFSYGNGELEDLEPFESLANGNEIYYGRPPVYLGDDIRINELAAKAGMTPNPDAEFIAPGRRFSDYNPIVRDFRPIYTNELPNGRLIEGPQAIASLNRDTYVNELTNPEALNPDAEVFDPIEAEIDAKNRQQQQQQRQQQQRRGKFERMIMPR